MYVDRLRTRIPLCNHIGSAIAKCLRSGVNAHGDSEWMACGLFLMSSPRAWDRWFGCTVRRCTLHKMYDDGTLRFDFECGSRV